MGHETSNPKRDASRRLFDSSFAVICLLLSSLVAVILVVMIVGIFYQGAGWLSPTFMTHGHRENVPEQSGIWQALVGSFVICVICAAFAIPVGIGTAVFLEEFKPRNSLLKWFHGVVQINISNLAGVPSIVYGILGVTAFVYMFGWFGVIQTDSPPNLEFGIEYRYQVKTLGGEYVTFACDDKTVQTTEIRESITAENKDGKPFELKVLAKGTPRPKEKAELNQAVFEGKSASITSRKKFYYMHLPFHKSVLAAGLTLALVILPIVIIASQEALRAVPNSLREAAFGLGATQWQVVRGTVIPSATPGIMTGAILAMSRAIGEAAPLIAVMGATISTTLGLTNMMDQSPTLPVIIYRWAQDDNRDYEGLSAAAIIVLLALLLVMNSVAVLIRYRAEKNKG
ncbi:MAG: PstA family ABC transporter permease [Pirellulaceae bacterium]